MNVVLQYMTDNKSKKVLVIGGAGYIGGELINALRNSNISYLSVDKRKSEDKNSIVLDLGDGEETLSLLLKYKPDVVVHAGTHSALAYQDDFLVSFDDDYISLQSLLSALKKTPNTRLIYFSSNYVYSGYTSDKKMSETNKLLPTHNFGVAKSFFEQYILRNHKESVVFRLSSVFGHGNTQHPNAISNFKDEAKDTGKVTVFGTGARMMQYVYMPDVIKFIIASFSIRPGIYNLGGDEYISVADAAKTVANYCGAKAVFLKDKPEGDTLPFISTEALSKEVSQEQFTSFSNATKEFFNFSHESR